MVNNRNLLYKSKPSIEDKIILIFIVILIVIIYPIMSETTINFTFGITMLFAIIIPILIFYYIFSGYQVKLYNNRIYYKGFKFQNPKNKITDIYYQDIKSAEFVKTFFKEQIEINTVNGKYIIAYINYKDFIPELKKQLKDKWKE